MSKLPVSSCRTDNLNKPTNTVYSGTYYYVTVVFLTTATAGLPKTLIITQNTNSQNIVINTCQYSDSFLTVRKRLQHTILILSFINNGHSGLEQLTATTPGALLLSILGTQLGRGTATWHKPKPRRDKHQ